MVLLVNAVSDFSLTSRTFILFPCENLFVARIFSYFVVRIGFTIARFFFCCDNFFLVVRIFFTVVRIFLLVWEFFFRWDNFFLVTRVFFAVRTFLLKILLSMMRILKAKSLKSKNFWQTMQKRSGGLCRSSLELRARSV